MNKDNVMNRFNHYKKFLLMNGANEELIELPAIKEIILYVIENGDPRNIVEGHSPISYRVPNEDGTFNIYGKLEGPTPSVVYEMEYNLDDDENHYIKLTKKDKRTFLFVGEEKNPDEIILINKEGIITDYYIDESKKKKLVKTK